MKVSEWLREYQLTGEVPDRPNEDSMLPFWAGWLIGNGSRIIIATVETHVDTAIRAAEFIERQAKT